MTTPSEWKPLKYRDGKWSYFDGDYGDLVSSFGYEMVREERVGDYQGDLYYLLRDGDRWGFLAVGYGSCSGCDALQACEKPTDVESLRESIHNNILWANSSGELWDRLVALDWKGNWYGEEGKAVGRKFLSHLHKPEVSESLRLLLLNDDTHDYVIADAAEECGLTSVATALRESYKAGEVRELLKENVGRVSEANG